MGMKFGPYGLDFEEVKNAVHGIDLGAMKSQFPKRLVSENKEIDLSPDLLVNDLQRVRDSFDDLTKKTDSFLLIGRRHLRDNNSWMHNSEQLMKGRNRCTLQMNPDDAAILQLIDKQSINVKSRVGEVELPLEVTNNMMPGVVCMPHGYGHGKKGVQLGVANKHAGVSINDLTDDLVIDELTGNAAFSNVKVTVKAA
jgi:anaerobic selenocysteine-containing dehydrogenase